jgi:hypothetical protein
VSIAAGGGVGTATGCTGGGTEGLEKVAGVIDDGGMDGGTG